MKEQDRHLALDGLRGVAVIGVLAFHDGRLDGGFLGVDLFFALSGFLITGLLLHEVRATGSVRLRAFWERRYRRLLPAYLLLLVLILPLLYRWGSPPQLSSARHAVLPALAHVANWHEIFQGGDYWALFADPSPLTHLWSLAVEQQFYLVWPIVVVVVARCRRWRGVLTAVSVALVLVSATLMWLLYDSTSPNRSYEGTDTRVSSILLGALVAILGLPSLVGRVRKRPLIEVVQWALVIALGWAWWATDGRGAGLAHGGMLAHSAASAALVATLAAPMPTSLRRVLTIAPLRGAGAISYGWYLWHWPIFVMLSERRTGLDGWALSAVRWPLSLMAALVSYYLLEMPIRTRRLVPKPRSLVVALSVAALVVGAVTVLMPRRQTVVATFDPTSVTLPPTTEPTTATVDALTTTTTLPRATVRRAIFSGDSIAFDASLGVIAALEAAGVPTTYAGYPGTGFTPIDSRYPVFVQPVLDAQPDLVVYQLSAWDDLKPTDEQQNSFEQYTEAILGSGAILLFVTPPPVDSSKVDNRVDFMLGLARELAAERPEEVFVLDSAEFWGDFAYDIDGDGVPDRKADGVHLCAQGAARYGNWLVLELSRIFDGFVPADPALWATGPWSTDARFNTPVGTCSSV